MNLASGGGIEGGGTSGDVTIGLLTSCATAQVLQWSGSSWACVDLAPPRHSGLYGNGVDGVCAFDGSTTVAGMTPSGNVYTFVRPYWCTSATISNGVLLKAQGYPLYVQDTFTANGTGSIGHDGNPGSSGNVGGGAGAGLADGWFALSASLAGGGGSPTSGGNAVGPGVSLACRGHATGGAGGSGASGPGGAGSVAADMPATIGDCQNWRTFEDAIFFNHATGANSGFFTGYGGGGGGALVLHTRIIAGTGTQMVHAIGGAGGGGATGAGCTTGSNGCGGGGGGGGSGGYIVWIYGSFIGSGCTMTSGSCYSVAGGAGGARTGVTSTNGSSGNLGVTVIENTN